MNSPTSGPWDAALAEAGVTDERVRAAMARVDRAAFLPERVRAAALEDRPLGIGHDQTTSQPTLIARMVEALRLQPGARVLEVGTGCGYQTALLAELGARVHSVDIVPALADEARARLAALGYREVEVRTSDGWLGWQEAAPFDGIVVCAASPTLPAPLLAQLASGGRLVIPVGASEEGTLEVVTRLPDGRLTRERLMPVRFVPLTGAHAAEWRARR